MVGWDIRWGRAGLEGACLWWGGEKRRKEETKRGHINRHASRVVAPRLGRVPRQQGPWLG